MGKRIKNIEKSLDIKPSVSIDMQRASDDIDRELNQLIQEKPIDDHEDVEETVQPSKKAQAKTKKQHKALNMRLFKPVCYKDAKTIAQALIQHQIAYVYLTHLEEREAGRIIDFLTGVVYGIAGDIQRIHGELFICTPADLPITDELLERVQ